MLGTPALVSLPAPPSLRSSISLDDDEELRLRLRPWLRLSRLLLRPRPALGPNYRTAVAIVCDTSDGSRTDTCR
eukprot:5046017-Prymnesium_polylepis.1